MQTQTAIFSTVRPRRSAVRVRSSQRGRDPYDALRFWSAATHGAGALLALIAAPALLIHARAGGRLACGLYALCMLALYTASCLYHCLCVSVRGRILLRKLDHASICLLIAGTYTPLCLLQLPAAVGRALLASVWALALGGIALSILWIGAPRWLSTAVYLCMGWAALGAMSPLRSALTGIEFFLLLAGGAAYSAGGLLYGLKWPGRNNPRFGCHEIFHVLVLIGSLFHFILVWMIA